VYYVVTVFIKANRYVVSLHLFIVVHATVVLPSRETEQGLTSHHTHYGSVLALTNLAWSP